VTTAERVGRQTPRPSATLALVIASFLFGSTFLVVKDAVERADVVPFLAVRFLVGTAVLLVPARRRLTRRTPGLLRGGLLAGSALAGGYLFQTWGLQHVTSTVSAFITYLLVVFVPVMSALLLRRVPTPITIVGVVLATVGLVLLTGGRFDLGRGELLTLGCALLFAVHIVVLADLAPRHDTVLLNFLQIGFVGSVLVVPGLVMGGYSFSIGAWLAAAYTGTAVTAGAFMLQVWAQRVVGPTRTALVLLLEPVFAAGLGYLAGDRLGIGGGVGAALILSAVLVSELGPSLRASLTARSTLRESDGLMSE